VNYQDKKQVKTKMSLGTAGWGKEICEQGGSQE